MSSTHDRFKVLDCMISAANQKSAIEAVADRLESGKGGYICFSNVY